MILKITWTRFFAHSLHGKVHQNTDNVIFWEIFTCLTKNLSSFKTRSFLIFIKDDFTLVTGKNLIKNPLWSSDRNSWKITRKWKSQGQAHCCYFRNWRVSNRKIIFSQLLNSISHASWKWKRKFGVAWGRKWGTHRVYMA